MKKFLKSKVFIISAAAALIIGGGVYAFVHFDNHPHHVMSRIMYNTGLLGGLSIDPRSRRGSG